jgi:hypothetical protein
VAPENLDPPDRVGDRAAAGASSSGQKQEPTPSGPSGEQSSAVFTQPDSGTRVQTGPGSGFIGHTAPTHDPLREDVFCPMLGALVERGDLSADASGRVKIAHVNRAMRSAEISLPFRFALTSTSPNANRLSDILRNILTLSFNLYRLRGGLVAHKGDSGILNGGTFDESRFAELIAHSEDGKTMTIASLARASTANGVRDGRRSANVRARANLAAIIIALGYDDDNGIRRIDIRTLRDLYEYKKLDFPRGTPNKTGLWHVVSVIAQMARSTPRQ